MAEWFSWIKKNKINTMNRTILLLTYCKKVTISNMYKWYCCGIYLGYEFFKSIKTNCNNYYMQKECVHEVYISKNNLAYRWEWYCLHYISEFHAPWVVSILFVLFTKLGKKIIRKYTGCCHPNFYRGNFTMFLRRSAQPRSYSIEGVAKISQQPVYHNA